MMQISEDNLTNIPLEICNAMSRIGEELAETASRLRRTINGLPRAGNVRLLHGLEQTIAEQPGGYFLVFLS